MELQPLHHFTIHVFGKPLSLFLQSGGPSVRSFNQSIPKQSSRTFIELQWYFSDLLPDGASFADSHFAQPEDTHADGLDIMYSGEDTPVKGEVLMVSINRVVSYHGTSQALKTRGMSSN